MTLDQGIRYSEAIYKARKERGGLADDAPGQEAIRLGIEALKAWEECRRKGLVPLGWVLPGETIDKGDT